MHPAVGSNVPSDRHFNYGDPDAKFAEADRMASLTIDYPRNSHTPLEGYVVVADISRTRASTMCSAIFRGHSRFTR